MPTLNFFVPGDYKSPLTPSCRGRTIAAFHIAQGDIDSLSKEVEMRRDVLRALMSPSAVKYWIDQKWLEIVRSGGRVQILRLTSTGVMNCTTSVRGGGHFPTTPELVADWRGNFKLGDGAAGKTVSFDPLPNSGQSGDL